MSEEYDEKEMYERSFEGPKPKLKGKSPLIIIFSAVAFCLVIAVSLYLFWPEEKSSYPIIKRQITAQMLSDDPTSAESSLPLTTNTDEQPTGEDAQLPQDVLIAEVQEIPQEDAAIQEQAPGSEISDTVNIDASTNADEADQLKEVTLLEKSAPTAEIKQDDTIKQESAVIATVPAEKVKIEKEQADRPDTSDKTMPTETKSSVIGKATGYMVQVGSFTSISRANIIKEKLGKKGFNVFIVTASVPQLGTRYRVRAGTYETRSNADSAAKKFKEMGMPTLVISPAR